MAVIHGDLFEHHDATFTVQPYDDGLTLLIIGLPHGVSFEDFPVELTRDAVLKLVAELMESTGG